ncbi:glycosyl transferase [Aureococcus anophagefferens]|nr:glycosyl transferase [Aureococcus anophagefferens]
MVCCPKFCGGCDEVQCQLRQARCCPAQIYKAGRACRGAGDAGCVFPREADNGTFAFCRGNARGAVGDAATCCPARCGRCDAACAGDAACCGAAVAAAGRAARADDAAASARGPSSTPAASRARRRTTRPATSTSSSPATASSRSASSPARRRAPLAPAGAPRDPRGRRPADGRRGARGAGLRPRRRARPRLRLRRRRLRGPELRGEPDDPRRRTRKGNLAAGPNFARFYLADLLPPGVDKVVYLDADTIVRKDVAHLFDTSLTSSTPRNFAVAAVSRRYKAMCGSFINCRSPEVTMLLKSQKITDPDAQLDPFNAGVLVVHLGRWRALELTRAVEFWMRWNSDLPLYKLGSNPPLVLAVRDRFQHLDNRWNCQRGHTCWDRGDAGALHWSGANKPWGLTFERDRVEWLPFAAPKCLAGLPELGAVYEATSAGDDRRFRPRRRSRNATGFGSRSAGVARRPAEGDRDLLWPAYDLVGRFEGTALPDDRAAAAARDALAAALEAQVGAYPPSDAPTFLRDARRAVRAMAGAATAARSSPASSGGRRGRASNFGKDAPCGVVPPPSLLRSLEFLSALLEAPFSRDVAFPDAACFVIAGEPLRASTVPEALDRVPVLAHAKADDRRGILVADLLVQNDAAAQFLARGARGLFDAVLCPRCAAAHWALAPSPRRRFGAGDAGAPRSAASAAR